MGGGASASGAQPKGPSPAELERAEALIVQMCQTQSEAGLMRQEALEEKLKGHISGTLIVFGLNSLLTKGRLIASQRANKRLSFRLQSAEDAAKLAGLSAEDRLIYQEIENSGSTGMSTKELRGRANMQHQQVGKVLKKLEARKLVQQVKSVAAKNKKVYVLVGVEPARELTGGSWYHEGEFDYELIRILKEAAIGYIQRRDKATASEVHAFIGETGLVRGKQLRVEDMETVLQTLVYDARAEMVNDPRLGPGHVYRMVPRMPRIETLAHAYTQLPDLSLCECVACAGGRREQPCALLTAWLAQAEPPRGGR